MTLAAVSLDDKYALEKGRVFLTAIQALVRLPLMQRQLDLARGLNTGGFISGYRGSPIGGYDQALWRAKRFLNQNHIHFQPGVNEDLAATAVWGSQQGALFPDAAYDGVFGIWYGKGPGVDRTVDVFKHANAAGTSKNGGVLAICGDDHAAVSSTLPHQSEHVFMSAMMPVLAPATIQEYLDYGMFGWAMSRYSGLWIALKLTSEGAESSASVAVDPARHQWATPTDFDMPPGGLNIRWPDSPLEQEARLQRHKAYAALAFVRANKLDRVVLDSPKPRFGIVTSGKTYLDVMQALEDLGIDRRFASEIGLRVYKVGMSWPLERDGARHFAEGLEEVLVVEEKRAIIENQFKEQLYNWRSDVRPRVVGKFDEKGEWVLPSASELSPAHIAIVIGKRLARFVTSPKIEERLSWLERKMKALDRERAATVRTPYFCSGCPHNSSTKVPEGSRALAGIGCHFMSQWMDRNTATFTQMGGEGAPWIGQAPFSTAKHVFANLGDGTYYHSGLLAIRAAVAAKVNMTYKILYNDAVAMTGGQPHDGPLTPAEITRQVAAEGVKRVVVVTDEPEKYPVGTNWASGVKIFHRDDLDQVQKDLREVEGTTVLLYDQTCAAEKRRRRKRGQFPDPDRRAFINDLVCEGCGDCSVASNCMSVVPQETEFGRKRKIDQSACNKDFSCLKGFCPSFVTVEGARVRRAKAGRAGAAGAAAEDPLADLPVPERAGAQEPYDILVAGVGGTGVITISALIGMAAHIEGKGVTALDQTGLAQKGGAVLSHVRVCDDPEKIHAVRIVTGGGELLIGCDLVVSGGREALSKLQNGHTRAIVNSAPIATAATVRNPDAAFDGGQLRRLLREATGDNLCEFVDAGGLATALMGDAIATNLFLLGYAAQRGTLPVSVEAIEKAIELNGVSVETSKRTFRWGRLAAHDPAKVERIARPAEPVAFQPARAETLAEIVERRAAFLTEYQDAAYAGRYRDIVAEVEAAEAARAKGLKGLAEAVARYLFKLMAYKDEYEVARLYTSGEFLKKLDRQFEGDYRIKFHLAPPLFADRDPATGRLVKAEYGSWMLAAFRLLAKFKGLRGTAWDVFGRTEERKAERQAIVDYVERVRELLKTLGPDNHRLAVEIASIPEKIRGFGHVKERHIVDARKKEAELLAAWRAPGPKVSAAE
jgi:indolepyruvate ferredoxin oxidoreductase